MKTTSIDVRHPYVGEVPEELIVGFETRRIDPEWQWVLVEDDKVKAQLLCCNAHGVLMMLRITALPDAPEGWALKLFRKVLSDCADQGMLGYMTFLSDATKPERRLLTIAARQGAYVVPVSGSWIAGRMENGY